MKSDRERRPMELRIKQPESEEKSYKVEGYASTFEPYVLFTKDGVDYSEKIEPTAFDGADLTDVVFRVDHEGPVYARTKAGTVQLDIDEHGLHNITDLSRTQRGSSGAETFLRTYRRGIIRRCPSPLRWQKTIMTRQHIPES